MFTADDISAMKAAGMTDEDILNDVRSNGPSQLKNDLEGMAQAGMSPSDILGELPGFSDKAQKLRRQNQKGFVETSKDALAHGTSTALGQYGKTAELLGADTISRGAKVASEAFKPTDYVPASEGWDNPLPEDTKVFGKGIGYIPRMVGESLPSLAVDIGVGALTGGVGAGLSYGSRTIGENVEKVAKNEGRDLKSATWGDISQAGVTTGAEAALNTLGLRGMVGTPARSVLDVGKQVVKATGKEAGTEAAQELTNQVGTSVGTQKGLQVNPGDIAASGLAGGLAGGMVRAGGGVTDTVQAHKFSDIDQESGARLVQRMEGLTANADPSKTKNTAELLKLTQGQIDTEIGAFSGQLNEFLKASEQDTPGSTAELRLELQKTITALKDGASDVTTSLQGLSQALGGTKQGAQLLRSLEDRQTFNRLKTKGREDMHGEFVGGVAPSVEFLNPLSLMKGRAQSALSTAGVYSIGPTAAITLAGQAALGPTLAAPVGVYTAARALDKITGNRNPTKQFMDRFSGETSPIDPSLPDFNKEHGELKNAEKEAHFENRLEKAAERAAIKAEDAERREANDINRNKNFQATKALKAQKALEKLERDEARVTRSEADYENRDFNLRERKRTKDEKDAERKRLEEENGLTIQSLKDRKAEQDQWTAMRSNARAIMRKERIKRANQKAEERVALSEATALRRDAENDNKNVDHQLTNVRKNMSAIQKVRAMEAKAKKQSEGGEEDLEVEDIAEAIRNAEPIQGTTTEQPKSTARKAQDALKKLQGSRDAPKAEKPASDAPKASSVAPKRPGDQRTLGEVLDGREFAAEGSWQRTLQNKIWEHIQPRVRDVTVNVSEGFRLRHPSVSGANAQYNPGTNEITIDREFFEGEGATKTLLHEATHAAVWKELETNDAANADLIALREYTEQRLKEDGWTDNSRQWKVAYDYGFGGDRKGKAHEFLAEALSNASFQEMLARTPLSTELANRLGMPKRSVWHAVVDVIHRALGLPSGTSTALEGVLRVFEKLTTTGTSKKATEALKKLKARSDTHKAEKPASDAPKRSQDHFVYKGRSHPLPSSMTNEEGYIKGIKFRQDQIEEAIEAARENTSSEAEAILKKYENDLHTARSKSQARRVIEKVFNETPDDDYEALESALAAILDVHTKD